MREKGRQLTNAIPKQDKEQRLEMEIGNGQEGEREGRINTEREMDEREREREEGTEKRSYITRLRALSSHQ